jgi:Lon protease-like protein
MFEIPLFPLNAVLFPGAPIHLHIFEDRYKQMINLCLQEKRSFGVVLIRNGMEALGPLADPFHIGCSAEIAHVERLEDGRMNLVAVGQERIRILSFDNQTQPYLVGKVRAYPLTNSDPTALAAQAALLRRQFEQLILLLSRAGGSQLDLSQLPQDGIALAFIAAAVLQISPLQKQELLSIERADKLLDRLQLLYRRELTLMQTVMADVKSLQAGGFSRN